VDGLCHLQHRNFYQIPTTLCQPHEEKGQQKEGEVPFFLL